MAKLGLALVHYPILDLAGKIVATNVTNFDIHDIARASRTFGVDHYFIVHPAKEQLMFVSRVLDHWKVGPGKKFNRMRRTALTMVEPIESLQKAAEFMDSDNLQILATSAREEDHKTLVSWKAARESMLERDTLLVFGTGNGLSSEAMAMCHAAIEPITGYGPEDYRHLSVRSAVSICLDRLRGTW